MRIGLICFIIGIVTAGNVMLQTADHNIFAEVFNTYVHIKLSRQNRVNLGVDCLAISHCSFKRVQHCKI